MVDGFVLAIMGRDLVKFADFWSDSCHIMTKVVHYFWQVILKSFSDKSDYFVSKIEKCLRVKGLKLAFF